MVFEGENKPIQICSISPGSATEGKKKEWVGSGEDREGKRKERTLKNRQEKERGGRGRGETNELQAALFPGNSIVPNQRTL